MSQAADVASTPPTVSAEAREREAQAIRGLTVAYALTAIILGCWYLLASVRFAGEPNVNTARRLLWTSLAHLPMLLAALTIDHIQLLQ